jgi:hypothetical protein
MGFVNCMHISEDLASSGTIKGFTECTSYCSWRMDFMSDSMVGARRFRTFNLFDDCTREVLAIEIDTSLSSKRIIRTL